MILLSVFGFESFRGVQEESIRASLQGSDALVVMATGAGKSLSYIFPTVYIREFESAKHSFEESPSGNIAVAAALHSLKRSLSSVGGCTIVISPLISLMRDQVQVLNETFNVRSVAFDSTTKNPSDVLYRIKNGEFYIVFTSPESASYVVKFLPTSVHLIAIDEAHCISEWGDNFRREYQTLGLLRPLFPGVPMVALTATATERVRIDISKHLELVNPAVLIASFDRPNLRYEVSPITNVRADISRVLHAVGEGGSIIVYTMSKNEAERVCLEINAFSSPSSFFSSSSSSSSPYSSSSKPLSDINDSPHRLADYYHGSRSVSEKNRVQDEFMNGKIRIVVATTAFGMGINKSDVRAVIHYGMPLSVDNYFQQTGRAGRDGKKALCVLFWAKADLGILRLMRIPKETVETMQKYCVDTSSCRRRRLLDHFDEKIQTARVCQQERCDVCLPTVIIPSILSSPLLSSLISSSSSSTTKFGKLTEGFSGSDFLADVNSKNDESDDEEKANNEEVDLEDGEGDDIQHHFASEDVSGLVARVGCWNLRASSCPTESLEEKVACLIFRASAEAWTAFVLQECSSQGSSSLIELFRRCEYFSDWNFSHAETKKGEVSLTAYDTSRWRRLDSNPIDKTIDNGCDLRPLLFTKADNAEEESQSFSRLPSLVFLQGREATDNGLILAIVNVHLSERSSSDDDRTIKEARLIASDVVPWVEQEAKRLSISGSTMASSSSSTSADIDQLQNVSILVLGGMNLAPPGSYMDASTHPKSAWDNLLASGFDCLLPSSGSGCPGVATNVLVYPKSKPHELDNAFFRKSIRSTSTSSSMLSSSSSSSSSSTITPSSFELKATGVVHELPSDQFNAWQQAQNLADAHLDALLKLLGVAVSLERSVSKKVKRATRLSFLDSFSDHKMLSITINQLPISTSLAAKDSLHSSSSSNNSDVSAKKEMAKRALELASYLKAAAVMTKSVNKEFSTLKKELKEKEGEQEWAYYVENSGTLLCKALNRKDYSAVPEKLITIKKVQTVSAKLEEDIERRGVFEFRRACGKELEKVDLAEEKPQAGKKRQRQ